MTIDLILRNNFKEYSDLIFSAIYFNFSSECSGNHQIYRWKKEQGIQRNVEKPFCKWSLWLWKRNKPESSWYKTKLSLSSKWKTMHVLFIPINTNFTMYLLGDINIINLKDLYKQRTSGGDDFVKEGYFVSENSKYFLRIFSWVCVSFNTFKFLL